MLLYDSNLKMYILIWSDLVIWNDVFHRYPPSLSVVCPNKWCDFTRFAVLLHSFDAHSAYCCIATVYLCTSHVWCERWWESRLSEWGIWTCTVRQKKEETSNLENDHLRLPEALLLYILVLIFSPFPGISRACPRFYWVSTLWRQIHS